VNTDHLSKRYNFRGWR